MKYNYLISLIMLMSGLFCFATIEEGDSIEESTIEFEGFHAIQSHRVVHFTWDVNAEQRGDHFIIEKSIDQKVWSEVTIVESLKSHRESHSYKISHINMPEAPSEYFRIVRVDKDGEKTFLDMIDIRQPILTGLLLLSSKGKANKEVNLSFDSMIASKGTLTVMDRKGVVVYERKLSLASGPNNILLWTKPFNDGLYLVKVEDEFGNKLEKELVVSRRNKQKRKF